MLLKKNESRKKYIYEIEIQKIIFLIILLYWKASLKKKRNTEKQFLSHPLFLLFAFLI